MQEQLEKQIEEEKSKSSSSSSSSSSGAQPNDAIEVLKNKKLEQVLKEREAEAAVRGDVIELSSDPESDDSDNSDDSDEEALRKSYTSYNYKGKRVYSNGQPPDSASDSDSDSRHPDPPRAFLARIRAAQDYMARQDMLLNSFTDDEKNSSALDAAFAALDSDSDSNILERRPPNTDRKRNAAALEVMLDDEDSDDEEDSRAASAAKKPRTKIIELFQDLRL